MPRISIVTVSFNSGKTIRRTIESVFGQSERPYEYLVIDGGSTDGTQDIVRSFGSAVTRFISEPDRGLYDAMNKGWRASTGDFVHFLNSDDHLATPGVLAWVRQALDRSDADALYGDLDIVDSEDRVVRRWRSGRFARVKYHFGWMSPHPVTFVRRALFEKYGGFRDDLRISADYELMLRFFYKHRSEVTYLPRTLVHMTAGGASQSSLRNIWKANLEVYRSWGLNDLVTSPTIIATKPLSKLLQLRL